MKKIFSHLAAAVLGFGIATAILIRHYSNLPPILIVLKNDSSKDIETVQIIRSQSSQAIPSKASAEEKLYVAGDGEYSLLVKFRDGTTLQGGGTYASGGDKVIEQISNEGIKTDYAGHSH